MNIPRSMELENIESDFKEFKGKIKNHEMSTEDYKLFSFFALGCLPKLLGEIKMLDSKINKLNKKLNK